MASTFHFTESSLMQKKSLDPSLYGAIDLILKRLKLVARQISTSLTAFEEESVLLDRLYYKGKNQHRTSKFWRHIEEMRRFHGRLGRLDLSGSVNRVRQVFHGSTDKENQNIPRSSWTHVPEPKRLKMAIDKLKRASELLLQMSEKYKSAYCLLKRAMQSGAFLQLILTLSAVSCRLHALTLLLLEHQKEIISCLVDLRSSLETTSPKPDPEHNLAVSPHQRISTDPSIFTISPSSQDPASPGLGGQLGLTPSVWEGISKGTESTVGHKSEETQEDRQSATESRAELPTNENLKPKLRGKKPKDEIDAIFGF